MVYFSKVLLTACLLATAGYAAAQGTNNGIIPGVTSQLCPTLNNPYGIVQVPENAGKLKQGAFLVSAWNDLANNPGAGTTIWQCQKDGQVAPFANITLPANSQCLKDGAGIGVTMALTYCGGVVIVGSTPIKEPAAGVASPGCLIALDQMGNFIADVKAPEINGPWGSTCSFNNNKITLFVSSVLGGDAPSIAQGGRKMLQNGFPGGMITRWTFDAPTPGSNWNLGQPTVLVSGIKTNATAIGGGAVGPGNPALSDEGVLYFPSFFDNGIGVIDNALYTGANPMVDMHNGIKGLNGPNSLFHHGKHLLGANTLDGNLFTIKIKDRKPDVDSTKLTLVDPGNTAGVLFDAIFGDDGRIYFVHDGTNTLNVVLTPMSPPPPTTVSPPPAIKSPPPPAPTTQSPPPPSNLCTSSYPANPCFCTGDYCFNFAGDSTDNLCAVPQGKNCHADTIQDPTGQLGPQYGNLKAGGSVCNC